MTLIKFTFYCAPKRLRRYTMRFLVIRRENHLGWILYISITSGINDSKLCWCQLQISKPSTSRLLVFSSLQLCHYQIAENPHLRECCFKEMSPSSSCHLQYEKQKGSLQKNVVNSVISRVIWEVPSVSLIFRHLWNWGTWNERRHCSS